MFLLHILLLLLKIIGILLLVLLCLVLLVLLVPIRYRFSLNRDAEIPLKLHLRVTWFLRLVHFQAGYINRTFACNLRVLGISFLRRKKVFGGTRPPEVKPAPESDEPGVPAPEPDIPEPEQDIPEPEQDISESDMISSKDAKKGDDEKAPQEEEKPENIHGKKSLPEEKKVDSERVLSEETAGDSVGELRVQSVEKTSDSQKDDGVSPELDSAAEKKINTKKKKKKAKTKKGRKKKKKKQSRVSSLAETLKSRLEALSEKKEELDALPWREWLEFGKDILVRLLRHILPRKLNGTIVFGFGDPALTGQILGLASVLYPVYGWSFSLYPDFNEKKFEADCEGKGRIRLGYLLILAVYILRNKDVRALIKKVISD